METVSFSDELAVAQEAVRIARRNYDDSTRKVAALEAGLAQLDVDFLHEVERCITEGLPDPVRPDGAAIQQQLDFKRVRAKAFANKLTTETAKLQEIEAAAMARRKAEFLAAADGPSRAAMNALRTLVECLAGLEELCADHGQPFHELPIDMTAPPGCGGFARPDPHPHARWRAVKELPYLFSEVDGIRKRWTADDIRVAEEHRTRHEYEEAERLKHEAAEAEHQWHKNNMVLNLASGEISVRGAELMRFTQ